jgi:hypothetical protein
MDLPSDQQPWHVLYGRICPYCGEPTTYCDSAVVYGKSYGMMYRCAPCRAWVCTHKRSPRQALGRLADLELRRWKQAAHARFDPLWKLKPGSRGDAYAWLAEEMGIPLDRTHIGMFNVAQCRRVIEICDTLVAKLTRP